MYKFSVNLRHAISELWVLINFFDELSNCNILKSMQHIKKILAEGLALKNTALQIYCPYYPRVYAVEIIGTARASVLKP